MVVAIRIIPNGSCGKDSRDAWCRYCAIQKGCQATEKAMALWVSPTQRAK
mgnify:CR=1 FL=1|jgi:hypothetical protein